MEYNQLDKVVIKTTKDVHFMSGPAGRPADPRGEWSVVGFQGNDTIVLAKDSIIISTKISNVRRIMQYDVEKVFKELDKITKSIIKAKNGKET